MDRKKKNLEETSQENETLEAMEEAAVEEEAIEVAPEVEEKEEEPAKPKRRSRKKVSDNPVSDVLENSIAPLLKEVAEIQGKYVTLNEQTETLLKNILEIQKSASEVLDKSKEPTIRKVNSVQKFSVVAVAVTFVLSAITFLMTQSIRKEVFQISMVTPSQPETYSRPETLNPGMMAMKKSPRHNSSKR